MFSIMLNETKKSFQKNNHKFVFATERNMQLTRKQNISIGAIQAKTIEHKTIKCNSTQIKKTCNKNREDYRKVNCFCWREIKWNETNPYHSNPVKTAQQSLPHTKKTEYYN